MADFEQTIDWPAWVLVHPDVLYASKTRLLEAMHTAVQKIADQAAEDYSPVSTKVQESFFVDDVYDASVLTVGIGNTYEKWPFIEENTSEHEEPPMLAPIAPLAAWVELNQLEISPYAVRAKLAAEGFHHPGTTGKHILEAAWEDGAAGLESAIDETYAQMMETWGAI